MQLYQHNKKHSLKLNPKWLSQWPLYNTKAKQLLDLGPFESSTIVPNIGWLAFSNKFVSKDHSKELDDNDIIENDICVMHAWTLPCVTLPHILLPHIHQNVYNISQLVKFCIQIYIVFLVPHQNPYSTNGGNSLP